MAEITKEAVEKRLAELQARERELLLEVNAVHGASLDCEYWLGVAVEEGDPPGDATGAIVGAE